jgi:hypothetical protein
MRRRISQWPAVTFPRTGIKNDYRDSVAITEAVQRPTMRPVPLKSAEQLNLQALRRVRHRLVDSAPQSSTRAAPSCSSGIPVRQGPASLREALPTAARPGGDEAFHLWIQIRSGRDLTPQHQLARIDKARRHANWSALALGSILFQGFLYSLCQLSALVGLRQELDLRIETAMVLEHSLRVARCQQDLQIRSEVPRVPDEFDSAHPVAEYDVRKEEIEVAELLQERETLITGKRRVDVIAE